MAWFFLIGGSVIVLFLAAGLVYAIAHGKGQAGVEFAIGLAIFGGTPWLGLKMLRGTVGE